MIMTVVEVIACGFPGVNWKRNGIYKSDQQKSHIVQGSLRGVKHFYGSMIRVFQNFQDKSRNFSGIFT